MRPTMTQLDSPSTPPGRVLSSLIVAMLVGSAGCSDDGALGHGARDGGGDVSASDRTNLDDATASPDVTADDGPASVDAPVSVDAASTDAYVFPDVFTDANDGPTGQAFNLATGSLNVDYGSYL